jgi:hypothetical protein
LNLKFILPSLPRSADERKPSEGSGRKHKGANSMSVSDRGNAISSALARKVLMRRFKETWRENRSAAVVAAGMMLLFILIG